MLSRPFYDPLSERWIKPRPEPAPPRAPGWQEILLSNYAAAEAAAREAARQAECARIWAITKQVAEGCCAPTRAAEVEAEVKIETGHGLVFDRCEPTVFTIYSEVSAEVIVALKRELLKRRPIECKVK